MIELCCGNLSVRCICTKFVKETGFHVVLQNYWPKNISILHFISVICTFLVQAKVMLLPGSSAVAMNSLVTAIFRAAESAFTCSKLTIETLEQGVKYR